MRNEKAVANKLTEALKVLMKFKKYCEDFDIKISDFEAYVRGKNKPYKLNGHSIKDIAWSAHGYADRLMIRFKSSKLLNTRVNALGYYYNAYQIPLTKLTITTLKESVKEEDKHSIVSEVKQWASKNKVKFHKYSKGATKEYLCCVCLIGSDNNLGVAVGKWNNKFVTGKWDNSDDPFIRNEFDTIEEVINYLNKWINSNEIKNIKKEVTSMCKVFKHKTTGVSVIASTKEDALKVFAFNAERIDDTTKALYEMMNEGSFHYNYRTDNKNFMKFINTTLWDEIQDTIKSSKDLIKKCIEKRSSNSNIVWHALFMIFSFVKQASRLRANITSDKMKNWFAFNNTDYKTALKKIVDDYMNDFRSELRESESKVTASRKWNNKDEWCQNYKEDFDDFWLPNINGLKKKLNKLKNIEFIVYYGDKTDSNLYFNKWAKWAYEEGYDIGSAPIKLMLWLKDIPATNNYKFVEDVEKEINKESEDDVWIFNNAYDTFDDWYAKIKKANDYVEKNHKITAESMDTHKIIYDLQKFAGSSLVAYFKDDTMNSFMPLNKNLTVCKDFAQEYEDNSKLLVLFKQFLISYPTKATIQLRSTKTGKVVYEIDSVNRKWKKFVNNVDKKNSKVYEKGMTSVEKKLKEYVTKFELQNDEIKDIIDLASKNKDIKKLNGAIIELIMKNSGYKDKKELFKDCQCDERAFIGFATFLSKNIEELTR